MNLPEAQTARHWLADILAGRPPDALAEWPHAAAELVEAARQHGVVALVDERLHASAKAREAWALAVPSPVRQSFQAAARDAALYSMFLEVETRRLLALMSQAGISGLLLKGQALAQWAYAAPQLRASGDVDVLLPSRQDAEMIASQLLAAGYELAHAMPEALVGYELTCVREVTGTVATVIDVHWRLSNSPLFGYRFTFDELMNESIALPGLGANARGLGQVHALIHACMHRAFNVSESDFHDSLKWLYDIPVLTRRFANADWDHFTALCGERALAGVCLMSLDAASDAFGSDVLALPPQVRAVLVLARASESMEVARLRQWRYREYQVMMALPAIGMRLCYLGQRFLPSREYMARLYQRPDLGYLGLMGIRVRAALGRLLG
ncbi:nucleotidyltransferase family protein [Rhodoferax sp.]|uniref:nucleotidyltransferase family protein n=1 Tax=Rhodoferax sp. TaxID=50421 RepID=UPI0026338A99|nr:nucleotidyltransferase family protein [Rhodoferax sp.]MDD2920257.1 nucleotidyltransferase family protein [Rhodoferax sp.]